MAENKHTAGPWQMLTFEGTRHKAPGGEWSEPDPLTIFIAIAFNNGKAINVAEVNCLPHCWDRETALTNGALISAAPFLLEVCQAVVNYYDAYLADIEGTGGLGADETNILNLAKTAIAKARGEL